MKQKIARKTRRKAVRKNIKEAIKTGRDELWRKCWTRLKLER